MKELVSKWNSLTADQKRAFGDRFITHDTNLEAWNKTFEELSELKKTRVLKNIKLINSDNLNYVKGSGIN
ncbi:hypothetical protein [Empedobacter falsenii]|uniref:Uncharacterized protein n=1 Tax=Empedobacter falsenii TaxID=343874 RepID=A0A427BSN0_9FLAO|nr:hypothetical protein [Empedobacter falsenii]RRT94155.1 hypothetical protein EGI89_01970 [Empedobacter falsenii]RRT94349.1 hypothetical protein EGI88_01975 [Empedobacter falsenii]